MLDDRRRGDDHHHREGQGAERRESRRRQHRRHLLPAHGLAQQGPGIGQGDGVEGDAPDGLDPVDVVMAALPAGTLSGAPKVRAMEIIDELEIEKRGIGYAGAVGYIGADGSVDTCIVLRTALVKDGMMYVQAGGGVVADSDADAEYDETLHKSRALKRAAEEAWRFA